MNPEIEEEDKFQLTYGEKTRLTFVCGSKSMREVSFSRKTEKNILYDATSATFKDSFDKN